MIYQIYHQKIKNELLVYTNSQEKFSKNIKKLLVDYITVLQYSYKIQIKNECMICAPLI